MPAVRRDRVQFRSLMQACNLDAMDRKGDRMKRSLVALVLAGVCGLPLLASPASAAQCGGNFNTFVAAMSREAAAAGVSQNVIDQAFAGVTQDQAVLSFDRRQRGTFRKTFEEYASTRVTAGRIKRGAAADADACRAAVAHRAAVRRARRAGRRDLGAGNRFRHRRHRQAAGDPHARHHGARLPPHRAVPGRAYRRAQDPPARRSAVARPDRRLCGRARPDAIPAVVLHQVRRRL